MENLSLDPDPLSSSTPHTAKKALKRPRDDMRNSTADVSDSVRNAPMVIDAEMDGTTGASDGDSGRSYSSESFEQCCDRHVRAFLRTNSGKAKPSTQQGLEHGDRTPSGGVFVAGVPRMFGGGNCFGRKDSIGSKSDGFSQQDPSELPPDLPTDDPNPSSGGQPNPGQPPPNPSNPDLPTGGQPLVGQPIAGQSFPTLDQPSSDESDSGQPNPNQPALDQPSPAQLTPGQPNPDEPNPRQPNPSSELPLNAPVPPPLQRSTADPIPSQGGPANPPRCLNLRGGSAELELSNVALAFAQGAPESNDRQPRGFEPLDLPSSSTQGQAVMDEPQDNEEESPPSRARENFGFLRHPETLLSRDPGPSTPRGGDPGASTSRGVVPGADPAPPSAEFSPPSPDTSFDQRVEYLSQQFIGPPSNPGSSSHSAASSFDSKRTASSGGSPEDFRETSAVPRGGEPVPWRELFDLLPEARRRGPRDTVMSDSNRPGQPSSSAQTGSRLQPSASAEQSPASSSDHSRPRVSITLSPGCSPERSIVLPGLPDDLALLCVARVPRRVLAQVKCVSKAWAMLIRSEELYKIRGDNGLSEPWLYALCESPRWGPWRVYDPVDRRWHFLRSPLPGLDRQLVHAKFSTIALHEKMLVVGGCYFRSGDPTEGTMLEMDQHALRDLRVYDPVKDRWSWAGNMNVARRSFAIGEIDGKVYVAGGLGQTGELLNSAEVYDPSTNRWTMLPSMSVARYGCAGAVLHGKLWTYAGRIHAGDENPGGWRASSSAEVFDPETATWRTVDEMWMRKDLPSPAAVLDEMLYTVDCEDDCKIKCYREATNSWFVVDQLPLPAEFKHAGCRLVAFNGELYMLGGTIFYRDGDLNRGRNVNTVEVFNPGALERGENAWRSAPNMGDGRGGIWGCAVLSL